MLRTVIPCEVSDPMCQACPEGCHTASPCLLSPPRMPRLRETKPPRGQDLKSSYLPKASIQVEERTLKQLVEDMCWLKRMETKMEKENPMVMFRNIEGKFSHLKICWILPKRRAKGHSEFGVAAGPFHAVLPAALWNSASLCNDRCCFQNLTVT